MTNDHDFSPEFTPVTDATAPRWLKLAERFAACTAVAALAITGANVARAAATPAETDTATACTPVGYHVQHSDVGDVLYVDLDQYGIRVSAGYLDATVWDCAGDWQRRPLPHNDAPRSAWIVTPAGESFDAGDHDQTAYAVPAESRRGLPPLLAIGDF